jgi:hypothetical protein
VSRDLRFKLLWALWMGVGGVATAAVVYVLTDSFGWAVVALLASGPVLNMIAQIVIQPIKAATGRRSPDDARPS